MKEKYKVPCCGDIVEVDRSERHTMNWCKCGKTGIDAEEWYTRFIGGQGRKLEE